MKKILRIVSFCIVLALILRWADKVFELKYNDGNYGMMKYYELDKNTLDVLMLGSSHAFGSFHTGILWEDYGIASYVLGGSFQPIWNTYYYLKEALKTQKPELIILEAYTLSLPDYYEDSRIMKNTFGMKWSKNKVDAITDSVPKERWWEFLLSYTQYHTRYTELSKEDFLKDKGSAEYKNWKGFVNFKSTVAFDEPSIRHVTSKGSMSTKAEKYYRKTIQLAINEHIPFLVVVSPYAGITKEDQAIFNTASDIAAEYGVDFINYNLYYEDMGLDFGSDMADPSHLNNRGNRKYTRLLGEYIVKHYKLTDRRGNLLYQSWEDGAQYLSADAKNWELVNDVNLESIMEKLKNPDYTLFVSIDGSCTSADERLKDLFGVFGIPCTGERGYWVVDGTKGVTYASGEGEAQFHLRPEYHDIYITRSFDEKSQDYVNSFIVDQMEYKKVLNGVNILIYSAATQSVADSFGVDKDNSYSLVR